MNNTPADLSPFSIRRERLNSLMQQHGGGLAVLATAPERTRNRDTHYPYRHDSHFYYLTGFTEPEAVLVLQSGGSPRTTLFCREKDPERETWDGFRFGPDGARAIFGFDEAYPIGTLAEKLPALMADAQTLFSPVGADPDWDRRLIDALNVVRAKARTGIEAPERLFELTVLLDEMRLIKDDSELAAMRRAAQISAGAHRRAMAATRPGRFEYEIEAELLCHFQQHGARAPAYPSIVASGANACVLHYVDNRRRMADGELLLIDAGCEFDGYAGDITRTFPVNGRFSPAQRDLYQLVLAAQSAALAAIAPGQAFDAAHEAAVGTLTQGFIDLGLLAGSLDENLAAERYKRFYMHRTGHWLGMDVHDVGRYKHNGQWRSLQPGMTLTVEPGCYIPAADDLPECFWQTGIRIEDDVLVTDDHHEVLTAAAPKTVAEIEDWMREARDAHG